mgnify:CR=1 FL=1
MTCVTFYFFNIHSYDLLSIISRFFSFKVKTYWLLSVVFCPFKANTYRLLSVAFCPFKAKAYWLLSVEFCPFKAKAYWLLSVEFCLFKVKTYWLLSVEFCPFRAKVYWLLYVVLWRSKSRFINCYLLYVCHSRSRFIDCYLLYFATPGQDSWPANHCFLPLVIRLNCLFSIVFLLFIIRNHHLPYSVFCFLYLVLTACHIAVSWHFRSGNIACHTPLFHFLIVGYFAAFVSYPYFFVRYISSSSSFSTQLSAPFLPLWD